ncbi:MAG: diacylglycerol kinase family lipid kinase [Lachnospiraceae bacterium]|nr:diacylglycerol kinase family lipid kinase [Lachnospiraceae bacterium]
MYYFIVNMKSGSGSASYCWSEIRSVLARRKVEYKAFRTKRKGHATVLAKKISRLEGRVINLIVVGGDGTINEVINGIEDFKKVRVGIIPTGSGNDCVRGLNISGSPGDILESILDNDDYMNIDLGRVKSNSMRKPRYYVISSGVGMDAIVCKKTIGSKQKRFLNRFGMGKLVYLLITIETLLSMRTVRGTISFDGEKSKEFDRLIFAAAMNLKAEGGGVPMAPTALPDDGRLSMCLAHDISRIMCFVKLPVLVCGRHDMLKGFVLRDFGSCVIHLERPVTLHADGEYLGEATDIYFEIQKNRLKLLNEIV